MRKMFRAHINVTCGYGYSRPERYYTIPVLFRDCDAATQAAIKSAKRVAARGYLNDEFGRPVWGKIDCKVWVTSERVTIV